MSTYVERESDPRELASQLIEPCWDTIDLHGSEEEFNASWAKVPKHIALLYAAWSCEAEVCNGGFLQFYENSSGALGPETVEGFRAIGLPAVAEVVAESLKIVGDPFPRCREEREDRIMDLTGDEEEPDLFDHLDDQFYDALGNSFDEAVGRYAARYLGGDAEG